MLSARAKIKWTGESVLIHQLYLLYVALSTHLYNILCCIKERDLLLQEMKAADDDMKWEIQEMLKIVKDDIQFWIELVKKKESETIHSEIEGEKNTTSTWV